MGGELGGPGGFAPRFRPRRYKGGLGGAEPPSLQVHGTPTGVRGLGPGLVG